MDFALMSCPYCGRAVDSSDPRRYVCMSCGKFIYTRRSDVRAFIRPGEIEDRFREAFAAQDDDNGRKAMDIAEDLVEATGGNDHDALFLRGYLYALNGEDGKSLADWKRGLELLSNDQNLDAYVCLMSEAVSRMILYKEEEFIEFNPIAHIDKLCEDIDSSTGMSCKAFVYYTVLRNCIERIMGLEEGERNEYGDIVPDLFRRVVAYQRNYWCLSRIIAEYLDLIGYQAETYEEDDNAVPHVYDLIRRELDAHIALMNEEDRVRIFDRWDDKSLKENIEPLLDAMVGPKRGGFLAKLRRRDAAEAADLDATIHAYVDRCLLIEVPAEEPEQRSEEPQVLQEYLGPHQDQDRPARDLRGGAEPPSHGAADPHAHHAQQHGDHADDQRGPRYRALCHRQRYPYGQGVYARGHRQREHRPRADVVPHPLLLPGEALPYHVQAYRRQEDERDPVVVVGDEVVHRIAENVSYHRHDPLEDAEPQPDHQHGAECRGAKRQPLAHGDRERVHRQTDCDQ